MPTVVKPLNKSMAKLKGKMTEKGQTQEMLAAKLGISKEHFSKKINNPKKNFWHNEILILVKELKLTQREAIEIFFPELLD